MTYQDQKDQIIHFINQKVEHIIDFYIIDH